MDTVTVTESECHGVTENSGSLPVAGQAGSLSLTLSPGGSVTIRVFFYSVVVASQQFGS